MFAVLSLLKIPLRLLGMVFKAIKLVVLIAIVAALYVWVWPMVQPYI